MAPSLDLSQVNLMNFRVEYVRLQSEREVLTKQDQESLRCAERIDRQLESICQSHLFSQVDPYFESCDILRQHLLRNL